MESSSHSSSSQHISQGPQSYDINNNEKQINRIATLLRKSKSSVKINKQSSQTIPQSDFDKKSLDSYQEHRRLIITNAIRNIGNPNSKLVQTMLNDFEFSRDQKLKTQRLRTSHQNLREQSTTFNHQGDATRAHQGFGSQAQRSRFLMKDLMPLMKQTQANESDQNLTMKFLNRLSDENFRNYLNKRENIDSRYDQFFVLNQTAQERIASASKTSSRQQQRRRIGQIIEEAKEEVAVPIAQKSQEIVIRNEEKRNYIDEAQIKDIVEQVGGMYFMQTDVQKALQLHLDRFSKFTVDFTLTKNKVKESIEQLFHRNLPEFKPSDEGNTIEEYEHRNLLLQRFNQIYTEDFNEIRARAEGIAYPMAMYAKDLTTPNYKFEQELTRRQGLASFLTEMNDCQRSILRELSHLSPENFGIMYCLDLLWKLVIVRIELLLNSEDEDRKNLQERIDVQQKKKMQESAYLQQTQTEQLRLKIDKLKISNQEMDQKIDNLTDEKMSLLDNLREKDNEMRILKEDLKTMTNKLQDLTQQLSSLQLPNELSKTQSIRPSKSLNEDQIDLYHQLSSQYSGGKKSFKAVSFEQNEDGTLDQGHNAKQTDPIVCESPLTKEGRSQGIPIYMPVDENMLASQVVLRSEASPQRIANEITRTNILSMLPISTPLNKIKVYKTRDQILQTDEDTDAFCSKCIMNVQRETTSQQQTNMDLVNPQVNSNNAIAHRKSVSISQQQQPLTPIPPQNVVHYNFIASPDEESIEVQGISKTKNSNQLSQAHKNVRGGKFLQKMNNQPGQQVNRNFSQLGGGQPSIAELLNPESREIVLMPEQTLLKHVEEILARKFEEDERRPSISQQQLLANTGKSGTQPQSASSFSSMINQQNIDILTFAYYHFLQQQGLKSLSIRYLNSLYAGLKKIYLKNQSENHFAQFLLQIFGFNPEDFPALRPDQTSVALRTRYLFQMAQKNQQIKMMQKQQRAMEILKTGGSVGQGFKPHDALYTQKGHAAGFANMTRLTNGGVVQLNELILYLFKCCKGQPKGLFSSILSHLTLQEVTYCQIQANKDDGGHPQALSPQDMQIKAQRHFVCFKILSLLAFSKLDLHTLSLKTDQRELQMDVVIMRLEEQLEIKLPQQELQLFKKEFDSFFLVPLKVLEQKMIHYVGYSQPPSIKLSQSLLQETNANLMIEDYFEISLIVLLNRVLEEWEHFQSQLRKKLLKKFIDFDANSDGVLTLDEFRELMKSLEGGNIQNERVIMLFNEALEMTTNLRDDDIKGGPSGSAASIAGGGQDKMSPSSFVEAVIRNRIGGYGSEFLNFDFLNKDNN